MKPSLGIDVLSITIPIEHPIGKRRKTPVYDDELCMNIEARHDSFWVWDYSCNYSSEIFAFDPQTDPRISMHVSQMPHLDEVFRFVAEQRVAHRSDLIGAFLEPAVLSMEAAIAKRDGSSVYFIDAGGQIKIGWSRKVSARLAQLQVGAATPLKLLATTPGGLALERRLHQQFHHLRLSGEWFLAAPELLDHIASIAPVIRIDSRRPA